MIISLNKKGYTVKDGDHIRTLKCPMAKTRSWHRDSYNFKDTTTLRYGFTAFKSIKETKTHTDYAKRLWESFWIEGWREKQL